MNPQPSKIISVIEARETGLGQACVPICQPPPAPRPRPIDWHQGATALWREPWFRRVLVGSVVFHLGFVFLSMMIRWQTGSAPTADSPQLPALVAITPAPTTVQPPTITKASPRRWNPLRHARASLPDPVVNHQLIPPATPATSAATTELSKAVNRLSHSHPVIIARPAMPSSVAPQYADRHNPPPTYPVAARERGWQGTTVLEVEVSASGKASQIKVSRSSGYGLLDRAAVEAVRRWQFDPGRIGETAIAMLVQIPIIFQLADG